jgi:hypothetical protein
MTVSNELEKDMDGRNCGLIKFLYDTCLEELKEKHTQKSLSG